MALAILTNFEHMYVFTSLAPSTWALLVWHPQSSRQAGTTILLHAHNPAGLA